MLDAAPIIHLASVTSTNDYLAHRWRESRERKIQAFTAVLADFQTRGRGRLDRQWIAPSGSALLLSVLVPHAPAKLRWLPLLAGMAVQDALAPLVPSRVDLKWPNDILVGGRKIGGILSEYLGESAGTAWVALGIGINLNQSRSELPEASATSLRVEGALPVSPTALAAQIVDNLRALLARPFSPADYANRCVSADSPVQVTLPGGEILVGVGTGIDDTGALLIQTEDGAISAITAGDVALIGGLPDDLSQLISSGGNL